MPSVVAKTGQHGLLVNLTGLGGAGKSTLLRDLPAAIRQRSHQMAACVVVDRASIRRAELLRTAVMHPSLLVLAFQLSAYFPGGSSVVKKHVTWYGRLLLHQYCRQVAREEPKPVIYLIDQGLLQFLGLSAGPFPKTLLARLPLPDVDLKLIVDRRTSIMRELERDKPAKEKQLFTGGARLKQGTAVAAMLLKTDPPEDVHCLLEQWGARFCRPTLASAEVSRILEELATKGHLREAIEKEFAQRAQGYARVSRMLEELGMDTVEIANQDGQDPSKVIARIADELLGRLQRPDCEELSN